MTPSFRAAALRSTALATSLALAVGLSVFAADAAATPTVPLPKPRPIARNVSCPNDSASATREYRAVATSPAPPQRAASHPRQLPHTGRQAAARLRTRARRSGPRRASMRLCRPRRAQTAPPAAVATTSSTSQADIDALENVIELVRKRKPADATQAAGGDIGSGRQKTRGMDHPAQRRQWRLGRALSRVHISQSELAFADLPAPAHRSSAVGRPSRRRHGVGMVRKRIAVVGQRKILAGAGDDRARRPGQCGASGARRLAKRFHVGGYREHGARPVRRTADRRAITRRGWIYCSMAASTTPRCAPRSGSGANHVALGESAHCGLSKRPPTPGRCWRRFRANCTAIPAISSARSSCCGAKRSSPRPRS